MPRITMPTDSKRSLSCDYREPPVGDYLCNPTDPNACEPCKRLFEIEAEAKEIILIDKECERQKLKMRVNQHHDKLGHRLPPEIAGKIFQSCIPGHIFDLDIPPMRSRFTFCSPLIISAVSTRWRDLAYSTPRLWNMLPLYSGLSDRFPAPSIVTKWIERAGQLPLFIFLDVPSHTTYDEPVFQMIDALNQASTRWRKLRLRGDTEVFSRFFNEGVPELRCIIFERTGDDGDIDIKMIPQRLISLSITGINDLSRLPEDFSWESLTQLKLEFIITSTFWEALHKAPNLVTFFVRLDYLDDDDDLPPFVHFHLQELDIFPASIMAPLQNLRCPSLKSFTFRSNGDGNEFETSCILSFLQQSQCPLTKLSFENEVYLSPSDISLICEGIPMLQDITLNIDELTEKSVLQSLFTHLTEVSPVNGKEVPRYLPVLRSLMLNLYEFSDWKMLVNIFGCHDGYQPVNHRPSLERINISVNRLQNRLGCPDEMDLRTLERIIQLKEAGVRWQCKYYHYGIWESDLIRCAAYYLGISKEIE